MRDGEIVAAAQEERFTRKRHDAGFPAQAVRYCLDEAGLALDAVDYVGFYDKPLLKFERLLEQYLGVAPRGLRQFTAAMPVWLREKLFTRRQILKELDGFCGEVLFAEHHESHAASAFYPSPFARSGGAHHGRGRGVGDVVVGRRARERARAAGRAALPALARHAVLGVHLLHRVQGQLRRVQGDGSRPVRRAPLRRPDPRPAGRAARRRLLQARHAVLRLPARADDDERRVRRALRRAGARAGDAGHAARDGPRGVGAGGDGGGGAAHGAPRPPRDRHAQPLPRRRRGSQLRRQRAAAARGTVRAPLGTAGGGRCRRRAGRGAGDSPPRAGCAASRPLRGRRHAGSYLGPAFDDDAIEATLRGLGAVFERLPRDAAARAHRSPAGGGARRRLVPGSHGVRPARARRPQHPRRPALAAHAVGAESQDQVPRELPPVRAERAARAPERVVRSRRRLAVHAARGAACAPRVAWR